MSWKELLLSKQYLFHKDNGLTLLESGSLGEARIEFEKALGILRRIKSLEEEELEIKLETISRSLTNQSIETAREFWNEGDLDMALNFFQNALGTVRNNILKDELIVEISRLKLEIQPSEQISSLQNEVKNSPGKVEKIFDLAMEYALAGFYEQAIYELKQVLEIDPKNEEAYLRLGNAYADTNHFMEARNAYQNGLELDGDLNAQFEYRLGQVFFNCQEFKESERFLLKSLEKDGEHIDALMILAKLYKRLGSRDQAIDYYERVLALDPEDGQTMLTVATLWEDSGYIKNSREIWREIQETNCDPIYKEEAREKLLFYESQV